MFDSCVLGVDPGIATTGLAAVTRTGGGPALQWAATLRTPSDLPEEIRLRRVYAAVREAIGEHRAGSLAVERVMWGQNKTSGLRVARATGAIMLAAADAGIPVEEYPPLQVKMAITGQGNASKHQVRDALARVHGLSDVPSQTDAADAVAVAVCHLTQSRLRRAAARATEGAHPR
jgi:crossover junction endodeoxyribonuclease RuvC